MWGLPQNFAEKMADVNCSFMFRAVTELMDIHRCPVFYFFSVGSFSYSRSLPDGDMKRVLLLCCEV
ncbi:hypothetical protein I7I53_03434 [Histoplasma capsulatum var. duboisii H88]|uniref:Uncharacterized protein n=1 Tax=Ajellomyces capsulatus (strain H88) TaxID=544711 RepID=A0A8A1LNZ3_AJEC8|nr:hypothetical protein I7I53_03434 [Histoplasma capsulatum var. duboisii H88]